MKKTILVVGWLLIVTVNIVQTTSSSADKPNIIKSVPGFEGELPFLLETGYVGIGEWEQVQLFYYLVESERDAERDPLLLWLTGGPGCSAFSSLCDDVGPFAFIYPVGESETLTPKLKYNPHTWTKVSSIIFLDSPSGTGFSYDTTTSGAYYSDDTLQSAQIYEFLRKWILKNPKFKGNPLYIAGGSYTAQVVPVVVQHVLNGNEIGSTPKMNLKGYILANPVTQWGVKTSVTNKYAHRVSLVSDEQYELAKISCNDEYDIVDSKNTKCLDAVQAISKDIDEINKEHILRNGCPKQSHLNFRSLENQMEGLQHEICTNDLFSMLSDTWMNEVGVQQALRIREGSISRWARCNLHLSYGAFTENVFAYHQNFTKKPLRALIYSGDQDMTAPYVGTQEWIKELQVPIKTDWRPWFVDGQVAGYVTEFVGNSFRLLFTTIKGAGHVDEKYKPKECLAMIERWFSQYPL